MTSIVGAPVITQVMDKKSRELEKKARDILLGRQITGVYLLDSQLLLQLDDGGSFTMNCEGGFNEVN